MTLFLLALALSAPVQAGCDEAEAFVARAETAVLEERLDDAGNALRDAEVAFSCGPLVDTDLLVRFWLAQGARKTQQGDVRAAALSFRSASMLEPEHWPVDYGIKPFIQYKAAAELWLGEGSIQIHPEPGERVTALDGALVSFPAPALEGLHLLQIGQSVEAMEFASFVHVKLDEPMMVLTGLTAPAVGQVEVEPVETDPSLRVHRGPRRALRIGALVVGGTAAALAGGGALLTKAQDDVMREQASQEDLDAAYGRQQTYAVATWGLAGLGVVGVTLHFAL